MQNVNGIESDGTTIKTRQPGRKKTKRKRELGRETRSGMLTPKRQHPPGAGRYYYNATLDINAFTTRCVVITRPLHRSPSGFNFIGTTTNKSTVTNGASPVTRALPLPETAGSGAFPYRVASNVLFLALAPPASPRNTCLSYFTVRS